MARSKYQMKVRAGRGGRHKRFNKEGETNRKWLKARRRVRRRMAR